MRNLLKILQRYGNFLVFILLEVVAFFLIIRNNVYPHSSLLSTANRFVAWQYGLVSQCTNYFNLQGINEQLAIENAELRTQLACADTTRYAACSVSDQLYIPATAVQMTFSQPHNYLTIDKGLNDSIYVGMGVRNGDGVVGIVKTVGPHYSVVVPLVHTESRLSCRFAKNDYSSTLQWDGLDYRFANLVDVDSYVVVNVGDTIVTSGITPAFPADIPVGTIESAILPEGGSYYEVRVRLATNFRRIRYVQVINNSHIREIEQLQHGMD